MTEAKRARHWLVLVAGGWFAAGIAIGLAVPGALERLRPSAAESDPDEDYVSRMTAEYQLTRDQQELLRLVRSAQVREQRAIYERAARDDWEQLPKGMASQLRLANQKAEQRVEALLTDSQRERFVRDRAGK